MITTTRITARAVIAVTGKGHHIYNDKLKSGARSLKVWGWTDKEYVLAKTQLEQEGYEVKLVRFTSQSGYGHKRTQTRLHVIE